MAGMNRRAPKRDLTEGPIVKALIRAGCSVVKISERGVPDLLVAYPMSLPYDESDPNFSMTLMEVKTGNAKLTTDEEKFFDAFRGPKIIVRTPQDALIYIGVQPDDCHLYID